MKLKKLVSCLLAVALVWCCMPEPALALSDDEVKAPSAMLMEAQTGKVLYEKNAHEQRACASITKVMTLLLVMEALDDGKISLTDTVTASAHASSMGGSDIWLKEGESMTVDDMLKATVIASANDAAVALAEFVCGSEDEFIALMNTRAAELGMKETMFKNCNGLDEDGHVTSAYDVALMSRELIRHPQIFTYAQVWMTNIRGGQTQLVNTNKLLKTYKGITGLKTGTTGKAGSCISATAERDGVSLVAVTLGSANAKDRFAAAAALLDFGFANWSVYTPQPPLAELTPVKVVNGMQETTAVTVSADNGSFIIPKGKANAVQSAVCLEESVRAPVETGMPVGKIKYTLDGETLRELEVCAAENVPKITFASCFGVLYHALVSP